MADHAPITLALRELRLRIESESRNYWLVAASIEYARRYWKQVEPDKRPEMLRHAPGDNCDPFKRLPLSPSAFVDETADALQSAREHAIVAFATTLETYLYDVIVGTCTYKPSLLTETKNEHKNERKNESGSHLTFTASEIAANLSGGHFQRWFAEQIAERTVRSKTPTKLYKRVCNLTKTDHKLVKAELNQWSTWSLIRNSIVHCGRKVSGELSRSLPGRYPIAGEPLNLGDEDIANISKLTLKLAQHLDRRYADTVVEHRDACHLAEEIFIAEGIDDPGCIAARVHETLKYRLEKRTAETIICGLKRSMP